VSRISYNLGGYRYNSSKDYPNFINMSTFKNGNRLIKLQNKTYTPSEIVREIFLPSGEKMFFSIMPRKKVEGASFLITDFSSKGNEVTLRGFYDKNLKPVFNKASCIIDTEKGLQPLTLKFLKLFKNAKV